MRGVALVAVALTVAGCSGHAAKQRTTAERRGDEDAEREEAARGLPAADKVAYFQLAIGIGSLRARASLVSLGRPGGKLANAKLDAAISRLRKLHPRDKTLVRLRRQTLDAVRSAVRSPLTGASARQAARRQVSTANRLSASLDSLVRTDPRFSALVPD